MPTRGNPHPSRVDMTGKRLGHWTVVARDPRFAAGGSVWVCRCDCGAERTMRGVLLRRYWPQCHECKRKTVYQPPRTATKRNTNLIDETGRRHGTWVVIARGGIDMGGATWDCRCVRCGSTRRIPGPQLRRETPGCRECGAAHVPSKRDQTTLVDPVSAFDPEPRVFVARCRSCQSMAGFVPGVRGAPRCCNCGLMGTAEFLPHVDGRAA
jgi:hypothetical protein